MQKILCKKLGAGVLVLMLVFSVYGVTKIQFAHAESGKGSTSQETVIAELQKTLEALLNQLIALLREQIATVSSNRGSNHDDSDDHDKSPLEIEAEIFTNETVVSIERNDSKSVFAIEDTTRDGIIDAILERTDLTRQEVDDVLTITEEDRASRPSDKELDDNNDNDDDSYSGNDDDNDDDSGNHGSGHDDGQDDD